MSHSYVPDEAIAAVATPRFPSALAIIRLSGKNCIELFSKNFSRPKKILSSNGNEIVYGWILDGEKKIDEVLISVFRSPKSFTGEDMIEISCHGGVRVVQSIFSLLLKNGFREAERGEFSFRSFINRKMDLTKTEAVREIIESKTDDARTHASFRLSGNLFSEIDEIKKQLLHTLSAIEVSVEYPEDEETIAHSFDSAELLLAQKKLRVLSETWKAEKIYQDGVRVVLAGKTNAGKSSLFNALLKEERAIVSDLAGTTRDWLESWADFAGIPVRLFDTAGLRNASDEIEKQGVELAKSLAHNADVVLYVIDATKKIDDDDEKFLIASENNVVVVWNKIDEAKNFLRDKKNGNVDLQKNCAHVFVSAKTGEGIFDLVCEVKSFVLQSEKTDVPCALGSERQKKLVDNALESISHGIENVECLSLDALIEDIEDALSSLGEITGEVSSSDVLDTIFKNFCVGK